MKRCQSVCLPVCLLKDNSGIYTRTDAIMRKIILQRTQQSCLVTMLRVNSTLLVYKYSQNDKLLENNARLAHSREGLQSGPQFVGPRATNFGEL